MFTKMISELRKEATKTIKTNAVLLAEFESYEKERIVQRVSGQASKDAVLNTSICLAGAAGLGLVVSALTGGSAASYPGMVAAGATIASAAGFFLQSIMPVDFDKGHGAANSMERLLANQVALSPAGKGAASAQDLALSAKRLIAQRVDDLVYRSMVEKMLEAGFVYTGNHSGRIMSVDGDVVVQRTHPSGAEVTHDRNRLTGPVAAGKSVDVRYDKAGSGVVSYKEKVSLSR